jgi:hypothetical protein
MQRSLGGSSIDLDRFLTLDQGSPHDRDTATIQIDKERAAAVSPVWRGC